VLRRRLFQQVFFVPHGKDRSDRREVFAGQARNFARQRLRPQFRKLVRTRRNMRWRGFLPEVLVRNLVRCPIVPPGHVQLKCCCDLRWKRHVRAWEHVFLRELHMRFEHRNLSVKLFDVLLLHTQRLLRGNQLCCKKASGPGVYES
jgi:hypothetical protein